MIFTIYGRAFKALMKQPIRVLGLSLLGTLVTCLGTALFGTPIGIGLAIGLLFNAAMSQVYLRSYRGEQCNSQDLFVTFKDIKLFKRTLGGMAWRELWLLIWGLIPFAGSVFAIIKGYQYALTPYILMNEEDVQPMDAIRASKERTVGYRGKMFLSDLLIGAAFCSALLIVFLLMMLVMRVPVLNFLFILLFLCLVAAIIALGPLFCGLVHAAYYEEIMNPTPKPEPAPKPQPQPQAWTPPAQPYAPQQPVQQPIAQQPVQQPYTPEAAAPAQPAYRFCMNCGTRFDANQTQICPACGKPI